MRRRKEKIENRLRIQQRQSDRRKKSQLARQRRSETDRVKCMQWLQDSLVIRLLILYLIMFIVDH